MRHLGRSLGLVSFGATIVVMAISVGCPSSSNPDPDQTARDVPSVGDEGSEHLLDFALPSSSELPWGAGDPPIRLRLPLSSDTSKHYFVDHDEKDKALRDWQCSDETYDGHHGTDFSGIVAGATVPVYASAAGTIIETENTRDDNFRDYVHQNGNFVRLDHGFDSQGNKISTVYCHLRKGSVTTKTSGTRVACGEQIGVVGNSGNSTGPHLHFEVQKVTPDGKKYPFDPYGGPCWQAGSCWVDQGNGSPSAQCDSPPVPEGCSYKLTVIPPDHGSVTLDPPGGTYDANTQVKLAATAASGWHFGHWEDGGSSSTRTVVMTGDITVTAVFVQDAPMQYGWQPLGTGMDAGNTEHSTAHAVLHMLVFQDMLIAAGRFSTAGGVAANNIASWDGSQWHAMGGGYPGSQPYGAALVTWNGYLIAAGWGPDHAALPDSVFRWTGSYWQPLSGGLTFQPTSMSVYNGQLVVSGYDDRSGHYFGYFKWNGSAWEEFCSNPNECVASDLLSYAGTLCSGNVTLPLVMRWNAGGWEPLGGGTENCGVMCLHELNGHLYAGGCFTSIGGVAANKVARWTGLEWVAADGGTDFDDICRLRTYKNQLAACTNISGTDHGLVMAWNGAQWSDLTASDLTTSPNGRVYDVVEFQGNLVAGGTFTSADGVTCNRIAKWAPLP